MPDHEFIPRLFAHAGEAVASAYRPVPGFVEEHGAGWWLSLAGAPVADHNWLCLCRAEGVEGFMAGIGRARAAGLPALIYVAAECAESVRPVLAGLGLAEIASTPAHHMAIADEPVVSADPRWRCRLVRSEDEFVAAMAVITRAFEDDPEIADRYLLPSMLDDPALEIMVAHDGGEPASAIMIHRSGELLYVVMMATDPARQRQGAGSALIGEALRHGWRSGARHVHLISSTAGEQLYRKTGFQMHERGALWMLPIR